MSMPRKIEIGGQSYRVKPPPPDSTFALALAAVRAPTTEDSPRMTASLTVLEGMLSDEEFDVLTDRLSDESDPLDTEALIIAAIECAQIAHAWPPGQGV